MARNRANSGPQQVAVRILFLFQLQTEIMMKGLVLAVLCVSARAAPEEDRVTELPGYTGETAQPPSTHYSGYVRTGETRGVPGALLYPDEWNPLSLTTLRPPWLLAAPPNPPVNVTPLRMPPPRGVAGGGAPAGAYCPLVPADDDAAGFEGPKIHVSIP